MFLDFIDNSEFKIYDNENFNLYNIANLNIFFKTQAHKLCSQNFI